MSREYNMYNENIKHEYIEYKRENAKLSPYFLERLFERTCKYEEELNKDLCDFNKDEIIDMYKAMNMHSLEILTNINSQLSSYAQYCLNNFIISDFQNHFSEIDIKTANTLLPAKSEYQIISRAALLEFAKSLPNASDSFILLCLFEGIRGLDCSEIRQIKIEDFNNDILRINTNHIKDINNEEVAPEYRAIHVSKELKEYALKANAELEYTPLKDTLQVTELAEEDPFIIKRTKRAWNCCIQPVFTRRLVSIFDYINDKYDVKINLISVRNSGKIAFIKERCLYEKITPEEFVLSPRFNEVNINFNDDIQRTIFWKKYSQYFD